MNKVLKNVMIMMIIFSLQHSFLQAALVPQPQQGLPAENDRVLVVPQAQPNAQQVLAPFRRADYQPPVVVPANNLDFFAADLEQETVRYIVDFDEIRTVIKANLNELMPLINQVYPGVGRFLRGVNLGDVVEGYARQLVIKSLAQLHLGFEDTMDFEHLGQLQIDLRQVVAYVAPGMEALVIAVAQGKPIEEIKNEVLKIAATYANQPEFQVTVTQLAQLLEVPQIQAGTAILDRFLPGAGRAINGVKELVGARVNVPNGAKQKTLQAQALYGEEVESDDDFILDGDLEEAVVEKIVAGKKAENSLAALQSEETRLRLQALLALKAQTLLEVEKALQAQQPVQLPADDEEDDVIELPRVIENPEELFNEHLKALRQGTALPAGLPEEYKARLQEIVQEEKVLRDLVIDGAQAYVFGAPEAEIDKNKKLLSGKKVKPKAEDGQVYNKNKNNENKQVDGVPAPVLGKPPVELVKPPAPVVPPAVEEPKKSSRWFLAAKIASGSALTGLTYKFVKAFKVEKQKALATKIFGIEQDTMLTDAQKAQQIKEAKAFFVAYRPTRQEALKAIGLVVGWAGFGALVHYK